MAESLIEFHPEHNFDIARRNFYFEIPLPPVTHVVCAAMRAVANLLEVEHCSITRVEFRPRSICLLVHREHAEKIQAYLFKAMDDAVDAEAEEKKASSTGS